jgi:hypothetical protein
MKTSGNDLSCPEHSDAPAGPYPSLRVHRMHLVFDKASEAIGGTMARVGEFCAVNVTKLLLSVVIFIGLLLASTVWMFYSPSHAPAIEQAPQKIVPAR